MGPNWVFVFQHRMAGLVAGGSDGNPTTLIMNEPLHDAIFRLPRVPGRDCCAPWLWDECVVRNSA